MPYHWILLFLQPNYDRHNSYIKIIYKNISMYLDPKEKQEIFAKHGKSATDTGNTEGQIALFTYRIQHLTGHLKANHKDYNTERSLVMLVGKRRSLLDYLMKKDILRYRAIVKELELRK
jgi:small subunit ribosomal protein S15